MLFEHLPACTVHGFVDGDPISIFAQTTAASHTVDLTFCFNHHFDKKDELPLLCQLGLCFAPLNFHLIVLFHSYLHSNIALITVPPLAELLFLRSSSALSFPSHGKETARRALTALQMDSARLGGSNSSTGGSPRNASADGGGAGVAGALAGSTSTDSLSGTSLAHSDSLGSTAPLHSAYPSSVHLNVVMSGTETFPEGTFPTSSHNNGGSSSTSNDILSSPNAINRVYLGTIFDAILNYCDYTYISQPDLFLFFFYISMFALQACTTHGLVRSSSRPRR